MAEQPVVVIGAGLAGLHAACVLAQRGVKVVVLERRSVPGGCCSPWEQDGYTFDIGPTMLQTPQVVEDAFADLGRDINDYIDLSQLPDAYRLFFHDESTLDLLPSVEATAERIRQLAPGDVAGFERYIEDMDRFKRTLKAFFIEQGRNGVGDYLSAANVRLLAKLSPWRTVRQMMRSYFKDPRVQDAFSFQTLYFGASPLTCPALYGMVPYFEITMGVWYARGGLNRIALGLAAVLEELGGELRTDASVERILTSGSRVTGVRLEDGEVIETDTVVSNADAIHTYLNLVDPADVPNRYRRKLARSTLSCSAEVTLLGVDPAAMEPGLHHNFLLPKSLDDVCRDVFEMGRQPSDVWAYLCHPSRSDDSVAPAGRSALYSLVLVPHESATYMSRTPEAAGQFAIQEAERLGFPGLGNGAEVVQALTPAYYRSSLNLPGGMVLGMQPTKRQFGPLRPSIRSPHVEGLILAGASANPGAGVPLVIASGRKAGIAAAERRGATSVPVSAPRAPAAV